MGGKATFYEWLQLRALRQFEGVIAVSQPLVAEVAAYGVAPDRIHMIANAWSPRQPPLEGSEARRALKLPNDDPVIGWVGRLIPVKGAEVFVEALARLRSSRWRAVVIGDGPTRSAMESLAQARGLARVSFLGSIPDAALYYSAFDVFVLSSHSEGTPITILEAMAARVPIVATRVGGVPAMLDSTDAVLVPPAQPLSLAAAIDDVIGRPHERAAITTRAAKKVAAEYNPEPWLDAHERVYRQLAARFRSSSAKFASGRRSLAAQLDRANSS